MLGNAVEHLNTILTNHQDQHTKIDENARTQMSSAQALFYTRAGLLATIVGLGVTLIKMKP